VPSVHDAALEKHFARIGRERADFGEVPNSGKWKFVVTGQFGATYIIFPLGRADIRYYLVSSSGTGVLRLNRQSKHNGKISRDWMIELPSPNKGEKGPKAIGTLGQYFTKGNLPKGVPKAALADLNMLRGYAIYDPADFHAGPSFSYLHPEGLESESLVEWRIPDQELQRLPLTAKPYPLTPEEKAAIAASFGK
jgi:hypothetical protein